MTKMIEKVQLVRETRKVERMIEIDGEQSQLRVELQLNNANGQFKIIMPITTKQVSRNPAVRAALLEQLASMAEEAMIAALEFRDEWGAGLNDGEDTPSLFDQYPNRPADTKPDQDFADEDEDFLNGVSEPEEPDAEEPVLSFDAPKRKAGRPRKTAPADAEDED